MDQTRRVCIGAAAFAGTAVAAATGLLLWTALADQGTPVTITGGVSASEVTQLDRVSALNDSQTLQEGAEAEYTYASTETVTTRLDSVTAAGTLIDESDLIETERTLTQVTVYAKASTESAVVCYILPDTLLAAPAQEDGLDWYEVYYNGMCGYVQADCLELDVDTESATAASALTYDDLYGTVIRDQYIYSSESTSSDILIALSEGETVELLSSEDGWYCVYYQGTTGYLTADYVDQSAEKPDWKTEEETAAARAALRTNIVTTAKKYLGCSYVWAAAGPNSFDCSGFTMYVMAKYGISLPHSAARQYANCGTSVSKSDLQEGDLVFFSSTGYYVSHVGIYIGNGQFIHASSASGEVTINNLTDSWYASAYVGARRVI